MTADGGSNEPEPPPPPLSDPFSSRFWRARAPLGVDVDSWRSPSPPPNPPNPNPNPGPQRERSLFSARSRASALWLRDRDGSGGARASGDGLCGLFPPLPDAGGSRSRATSPGRSRVCTKRPGAVFEGGSADAGGDGVARAASWATASRVSRSLMRSWW